MKKNMKKSIFGLLLAILLICPFMTQTLRVEANDTGSEVTEEVKINVTDTNQMNYFKYTAYSGKSWIVNQEQEAYIDLGTSDTNAGQCYYELMFNGSAVEIYAVKAPAHGKVLYMVDGEYSQTVDLYQSSRSGAVSVYRITGLSEGSHTLKAVTLNEKTGSKVVNQVAYAKVTHQPYIGTPDLGGTVKSTDDQCTQNQYAAVSKETATETEVTAWKNDKANSELVLFSQNCSLENVRVTASDLTNGTSKITADHVQTLFVKSTKAYNGSYLGYGSKDRAVPADNGSNSRRNRNAAGISLYRKSTGCSSAGCR